MSDQIEDRMTTAAEGLFTRAGVSDPFPYYAELLDAPQLPFGPEGALLPWYDEAAALLRDPRFGHPEGSLPEDATELARLQSRMFILRNPPDHTRLRRMVNRAFTPRTVRELRPAITETVERLLDDVPACGPVDLIDRLAAPLPVSVIADMLGIPTSDREAFRRWSEDLVEPVDHDPVAMQRAARSGAAFADYLRQLIARRRSAPGSDLVSGLVQGGDDDPEVTDEDLVATCQLLLFAGHETTVNLIGNGILALLRHPDQVDRLRDDPHLARSAVEELLRYDGPVHLTARVALEPATVAGVELAPGDKVTVLLGAANRDPRRFDDPDGLDITREDNQHLGFGMGIHFCLGAPLARLEAQIAIPALLQRFPRLALPDEPELMWRPSLMLRGLTALPVTTG